MVCITLPGWLTGFWQKKQEGNNQDNPSPSEMSNQVTGLTSDVEKTMEELRLYSFEREVLSAALTTIYEAEVKGILKVSERDRLSERYKKEVQILEREIEERRKVAELVDLEKERTELKTHFSQKMQEIEQKIEQLKSLIGSLPPVDLNKVDIGKPLPENLVHLDKELTVAEPTEKATKMKTKGEEKMDALREEVLKAIERLDQIEGEV
jgi:seryl-tRNA synthetase